MILRSQTLFRQVLLGGILLVLLSSSAQTGLSEQEEIFQWLVGLKGDSIIKRANEDFRSKVSATQLNQGVAMLQFQLGMIKKVEDWRKRTGDDILRTYSRRLFFRQHVATLTVSFKNDSLAGLLIGQPLPVDDIPLAFNEQEVNVSTDGFDLPGRLTMPIDKNNRMVPCVILVHGSGPNNMNETVGKCRPFLDLAVGLSKRGIAVLRYDKRSYVYGDDMAGEGRNIDYDTETVDDAVAAIHLAMKQHDIDSTRIFIVGHSLGGMLAPRIAQRENRLRGIVLIAAPPMTLKEVLEKQIGRMMPFPNTAKADSLIAETLHKLPSTYLEMDKVYSVAMTTRDLKLPILILQGERDAQVTMEDFEKWDQYITGKENIVTKTYPFLNHLMMEGSGPPNASEYQAENHIPNIVLDDIANFVFNNRLR